ncbi:hypothetical protein Bbelb_191790 [Branchiostoma belcheri]|nr:hypothetical protein Bbelb_191790 [Branchiostoma belcheri]
MGIGYNSTGYRLVTRDHPRWKDEDEATPNKDPNICLEITDEGFKQMLGDCFLSDSRASLTVLNSLFNNLQFSLQVAIRRSHSATGAPSDSSQNCNTFFNSTVSSLANFDTVIRRSHSAT